MSALLLAVVVIAVLLAVAVVVALPRLRPGRGRRPLAARHPAAAAEPRAEAEVADRGRRPREERQLIAEGEAIREHVEARLAAEPRPTAYPVERDPLAAGDERAWQLEQEQRERYPSTYRAAAGGYVPAAEPVYGRPDVPGPPVESARDELAWQIERDRRERHPADYPVAGELGSPVGPRGGGLQPEMPPVSDALELQLQEIAVRERALRPAGRRRFVRGRRGAVDPEDPRLGG